MSGSSHPAASLMRPSSTRRPPNLRGAAAIREAVWWDGRHKEVPVGARRQWVAQRAFWRLIHRLLPPIGLASAPNIPVIAISLQPAAGCQVISGHLTAAGLTMP